MLPQTSNSPAVFSRRRFLQAGTLGALNLFWQDWARAAVSQTPRESGKAKAVILIFNAGAPSHVDLWDPKPDASAEIRGEFKTIQTNVPGLQVTELMPRLAQRAHRLAVVRTVHHTHGGHNSGMHWSIVGRPYRLDSTLINPSRTDFPSFGTLVGWLARRDGYSSPLPPYVITPFPHCDSKVYITPGQFGGCLGVKHDPLVVNADPNAADFKVPNLGLAEEMSPVRLDGRRALLGRLDEPAFALPEEFAREYAANQATAFSLTTSAAVQRAFDLKQEPDAVRDRYGRHSWGQSHLLARRLIEAGVRFVTTVNGPSIVWDTHHDNTQRLKDRLVPPMETAFVALLDDLADRGLLDSTLIVWMGDFGRTPVINNRGGRDHWPHCYSMVLAGGGIHGGQVIGRSDAIGGRPKDHPLTPADIHATVFAALGYNPHGITYPSALGVLQLLSEGEPIRGLL